MKKLIYLMFAFTSWNTVQLQINLRRHLRKKTIFLLFRRRVAPSKYRSAFNVFRILYKRTIFNTFFLIHCIQVTKYTYPEVKNRRKTEPASATRAHIRSFKNLHAAYDLPDHKGNLFYNSTAPILKFCSNVPKLFSHEFCYFQFFFSLL